jgi:polysaccharide biosynthesis/export protein
MRQLIVFFLVAGFAAGASAAGVNTWALQDKSQDKSDDTAAAKKQTAAPSGQGPQAPHVDPDYKIGPQDVLQIDVWKEPEITRAVPVRPDGKVTLPLLNDIQAAGLTPEELGRVISEGLKKYINNPQVTVSVSAINSRRVYVTGEVARPGAFPLLPNMNVLQALTSAGGFTQFAKIKGIYVLRMAGSQQVKLLFNYKAVISGKKPEDNIQLQSGDTIVVP